MKEKLFSWLKRLVSGVAALLFLYLLLALVLTLIYPRFFYHLLYFGDHISGTVRLVVDGEQVPLDAEAFQNLTDGSMMGRRLRVRPRADGSVRIAFRAGDYGPYRFSLRSETMEEPLELTVYQYNNWNVCRFELEIAVDREAGVVEYHGQAKALNEEARFEECQYPEESCRNYLGEELRFTILGC